MYVPLLLTTNQALVLFPILISLPALVISTPSIAPLVILMVTDKFTLLILPVIFNAIGWYYLNSAS
jgi:hypothetical protein